MKRGDTLLLLLALNLTAGCASYELKYGALDMEMYQEPLQPPIPTYPPAPPPPAPDTNRTSRVENSEIEKAPSGESLAAFCLL